MQKNLQAHARIYAFILADLFRSQSISGRLSSATRGARHLSLGVRLTDPRQVDRALKLAEPLALASKTETVLAQRITGLVMYQFELQKSFWQFFTRADVTGLEVGLAEQRRPVRFTFDDAPHALFAGTSNSGKTEAIKSALIALLTTYTPNELRIVVIDTNSELSEFTNSAHLAVPIAADPMEGEHALQFVYQTLIRRKANNIKDDHRLVLVVDEVSDLIDTEALKPIAKQGRKYNVNLIIGNQRPKQKDLPDILDNLLNRFIGQVDNAQTSAMLTGHNALNAHRLTGKGDFLHINNGGQADRFQVALATAADFSSIERAEVKPVYFQPQPIATLPELTNPNGGRPELRIEYSMLGRYFAHRVLKQHLSIAAAERHFGHKRTLHSRYTGALSEFITGFSAELKRLREAT